MLETLRERLLSVQQDFTSGFNTLMEELGQRDRTGAKLFTPGVA